MDKSSPPSPSASQSGTILQIRTFAEDLKRAQDSTGVRAETPPLRDTGSPPVVPVIPMPKHGALPEKTNEEKLQAELTRHAAPLSESLPSVHSTPIGHSSSVVSPQGAFDIREMASEAVGEATIINDREIRRPSAFEEMVGQWVSFWNDRVLSLFAPHQGHDAEIRMDIAPSIQSPAWSLGQKETPVPGIRTLAHDAEEVQKGKRAALPEVKTENWKRISEPRAHGPVPNATNDELAVYRTALHAIPKRPAPPQGEIKKPFKVAREMRAPVSQTADLISKNQNYAVAPETDARERLSRLAQTPKPAEKAVSRDIPFTPPAPTPTPLSTPIRTYRYDALSDVKERNLSTQQIAAQEAIRRESGQPSINATQRPTTSNRSWLIPAVGTVVVVALVLSGGLYFYLRAPSTTPTETVVSGVPSFFATDTEVPVAFTTDRILLLSLLNTARSSAVLDTANYAHIYPSKKDASGEHAVPTSEIMKTIDPRAPGVFIRALGETMMFGAYGAHHEPFVILKVAPFDTAFAGMLAWEDYLGTDFAPYFGDPVRRSYDPNALTVDQTRAAHFTDTVIQNHDVRILYDEYGAERMLYTLSGDKVLITRDSETLQALFRQLP